MGITHFRKCTTVEFITYPMAMALLVIYDRVLGDVYASLSQHPQYNRYLDVDLDSNLNIIELNYEALNRID